MTRRQWLLLWCAVVLLLLAGTTMPGSLKAEIEGHMWHAWPWSGSAHFTLFAVIAAIPVYGQVRTWPLRALAVALLLGVLTEWLQSFVPGRHPLLRDVLIDLAGATAGVLASTVWMQKSPREAGFGSRD